MILHRNSIITALSLLLAPLGGNEVYGFVPNHVVVGNVKNIISNKNHHPNHLPPPLGVSSSVPATSTSTSGSDMNAAASGSSSNGGSSSSSTSSSLFQVQQNTRKPMGKVKSKITQLALTAYIASMCLALPIALFPPYVLHKLGFITKLKKEQLALRAGEFCARNLLKIIPFCKIHKIGEPEQDPQPAIWVCNHVSMLDIFLLLAADKKLKGKSKRPIKIVYWKQLEDNPITKLLFQQSGFIPVQMTANKAGEANDYDMKSFKALLKSTKQAFEDGYDIGILPEGQLNPTPEAGLLPCFSGAFTLAKMSRRPIHMMALHGSHHLWHADESIGMTVTGRDVSIRLYPGGCKFKSADEFLATFNAVVGEFGATGKDLPTEELNGWLDGSAWEKLQQQEQES